MADEKWYFTKEQLAETPSRRCGIDADKELSYRQQAANFIQDMGQRLVVYESKISLLVKNASHAPNRQTHERSWVLRCMRARARVCIILLFSRARFCAPSTRVPSAKCFCAHGLTVYKSVMQLSFRATAWLRFPSECTVLAVFRGKGTTRCNIVFVVMCRASRYIERRLVYTRIHETERDSDIVCA